MRIPCPICNGDSVDEDLPYCERCDSTGVIEMPTKVIDMTTKNFPIEACVQCGELFVDPDDRLMYCSKKDRELEDLTTIPDWCPLEDAQRDEWLMKRVKRLCEIIVNSPPDTPIMGEIESIAFEIGHHPDVMNAERDV